MEDTEDISKDDSKSPSVRIDSDINVKEENDATESKDDLHSSLDKMDSYVKDKNEESPQTQKDPKSILKKTNNDTNEKKKGKPGTATFESLLKKSGSNVNDKEEVPKVPSILFRKPEEEIHKPELMFAEVDNKEHLIEIKEENETSNGESSLEIQEKPDISEDSVDEKKVAPSTSLFDSDITPISEIHKSSANLKRSQQENSEFGKDKDKSSASTEISSQNGSSEKHSEQKENKSVTIDADAAQKPAGHQYSRWRAEPRRSSLRRKLAAFEKELTMDSINRRVSNIFPPNIFKGGSDDTSGESKDASESAEGSEDGKKRKRSYLSPTMASIFLISASTGYSMISLPYYLSMSNWFGVFIIILLGLNAMYAGMCLGRSWLIMEELWPEYLRYSRIPYQEIGYRSAGIIMKYFIALCMDVSVFMVCCVFIILISDSIENFAYNWIPFCYLMIIVTVILLPFSMFGSFRDMKFIAIIDGLLSVIFLLLLIVGVFLDRPLSGRATYNEKSFNSLIRAFGGFSFAYGVGPPLCNILMDMEHRAEFSHSCATAFLTVILIYVTTAIMGYAAYGDATTPYILENILTNAKFRPLGIVMDVMFILQLMTSFAIFLLPSLLQIEVRVKCPDRFGLYRVLVRLFVVVCILLLVLGVPQLTLYVNFFNSTLINMLTFILPPLCYVLLVKQCPKNSERQINKKEWFLIIETIVIGTVVAIISIWNAVEDFDDSSKHRPSCYLGMSNESTVKEWMHLRRST